MEMQVNVIVRDEDGELYPAVVLEWLASFYDVNGTRFRSAEVPLEFGTMETFQMGFSRMSVLGHTFTSRDPKYRRWEWHSPEERSLPIWVPKESLTASGGSCPVPSSAYDIM